MPPVVTLAFTAASALVNLWLAARISQLRYRLKVNTGDGGDPRLLARMRAQANFIEYVPLCLLMMGLIELCGGDRRPLWLLGATLLVGRLCHGLGMDRTGEARLRVVGIALTWLVTLALIGWALWRAWLAGHAGVGTGTGMAAIG